VVEVAGRLVDGVLKGARVDSLPAAVRAFTARELEIQRLAVAAAVEGSRELALQALLLDPVVGSSRAAEAFLDDVLREHRRLLPRFH
jgi:alpha-galactosidase